MNVVNIASYVCIYVATVHMINQCNMQNFISVNKPYSAKFWQGKTGELGKPKTFANILPSQIPDSLKQLANVSYCKFANIISH